MIKKKCFCFKTMVKKCLIQRTASLREHMLFFIFIDAHISYFQTFCWAVFQERGALIKQQMKRNAILQCVNSFVSLTASKQA